MRNFFFIFFGLILGLNLALSDVAAGGYSALGKLISYDSRGNTIYIEIMRLDGEHYDFLSQHTDVNDCEVFNLTLMPHVEIRKFLDIVYDRRVIEATRENLEVLEALEKVEAEILISFIGGAGPLTQARKCDFEAVISEHTFDELSVDNPFIMVGLFPS